MAPIYFEEDESEDDSESCPDCGCHLFTVDHYLDAGYSGNLFTAFRVIVETYRAWLVGTNQRHLTLYIEQMGNPPTRQLDVSQLRGKDLACWCPIGQPCHADVLLELANKETA
jgi:hypothetical protein